MAKLKSFGLIVLGEEILKLCHAVINVHSYVDLNEKEQTEKGKTEHVQFEKKRGTRKRNSTIF